MKQLIIIRGLSGSGKTTLADTICGDNEGRFVVSADDFFTDEHGSYSFDHTKIKEAHKWCQSECVEAMEDGFDVVVVHNTFTRKWEVDPYLKMAQDKEFQVQVINLYDGGLSDRELSDRCGHNLPPHLIQKQRKRWDKDVYRKKKYDNYAHVPRHPQYYNPYPHQHSPYPHQHNPYHRHHNDHRNGDSYQKRGRNW